MLRNWWRTRAVNSFFISQPRSSIFLSAAKESSILKKLRIYFLNKLAPKAIVIINKTRKTKNKIFAMEAAPAASPPKPNIAATIAIMKNIAAQRNILIMYF